MTICCLASKVQLRPWRYDRCTDCGHRQAMPGRRHVRTLRLPPWYWPLEVVDRRRARRVLRYKIRP